MTTAISAATAASATTANSAKQLSADMNTFLTLMTTQMKNQDPLDPMKSSEYTQQLATYSQVEQAIQQTSKLDQILNQMSSQSLTSAASYVGMSVTTQQSTATLGPGGARWSYDVPASATATKLSVVDSSGRVILETSGPTSQGTHDFAWSGNTSAGAQAPAGPYTLKVVAVSSTGETPVAAGVSGKVDSAVMANGALALNIGGTQVALSDLRSVRASAQ